MKLILDTVNSKAIADLYSMTEVDGVTSNPTIVSKEAPEGYSAEDTITAALSVVKANDPNGEFHIQVISTETSDIIKEAHEILEKYGSDIYIKIPVTSEGLKAIRTLHGENVHITATAIYSFTQAFLALKAGADYAALYCNRMLNNGVDFRKVIKQLKAIMPSGQILAASFKSIEQVIDAYEAGADSCTVSPALLLDALDSPLVIKAVEDFNDNWSRRFN